MFFFFLLVKFSFPFESYSLYQHHDERVFGYMTLVVLTIIFASVSSSFFFPFSFQTHFSRSLYYTLFLHRYVI